MENLWARIQERTFRCRENPGKQLIDPAAILPAAVATCPLYDQREVAAIEEWAKGLELHRCEDGCTCNVITPLDFLTVVKQGRSA